MIRFNAYFFGECVESDSMRFLLRYSLCLLVICISVACSSLQTRSSIVSPDVDASIEDDFFSDDKNEKGYPKKEIGYAAWYGSELHGHTMISGKKFNMYKLMGVHKDFPLGSRVRIKNLKNNRETEVTIVDRGPYIDGRVIDVSYAAAKILGFADKGVTKVEVSLVDGSKKLGPPKRPGTARVGKGYKFLSKDRPSGYTVQLGAFRNRSNAESYISELQRRFSEKAFLAEYQGWYVVWLGDFKGSSGARGFMRNLQEKGVDVVYIGKK